MGIRNNVRTLVFRLLFLYKVLVYGAIAPPQAINTIIYIVQTYHTLYLFKFSISEIIIYRIHLYYYVPCDLTKHQQQTESIIKDISLNNYNFSSLLYDRNCY